ncbi:MAG TPA: FAD-dependent oxidoreductase [Planctomycetaceae bacterium]|jgi:hypothetical protein|nr:FAD-dependent oxidoreductase [Planctomycetaceae bacterium]
MTHHSIVVCGGGAAGIASAISAARRHVNVVLVERRPQIGGTVTHALIHTLGGLYDSNGQLLNGGLAAELERRLKEADPQAATRRMGQIWVLNVRPWIYARVVRDWIAQHANIQVRCGTRVVGVAIENRHVAAVDLCGPRVIETIAANQVIDATGSAEVVRLIDPNLVEDDPERSAGGWIFTLRGVAPGALDVPSGLACVRALRAAAQSGALPAQCEKTWLDRGVSNDEVYVKLFVPLSNDWREREAAIAREMRSWQAPILDVLHSLPGFAQARIDRSGQLGVRDGGRIRGEYRLTADDVLSARRFPDPACRCSWPIEYWHPERGVSLTYLEAGDFYEVPLRALQLAGYENVWAVGKCLSADRYAHASARVVGTCWAMGEAVGSAAAAGGVLDHAECR